MRLTPWPTLYAEAETDRSDAFEDSALPRDERCHWKVSYYLIRLTYPVHHALGEGSANHSSQSFLS